MKVSLRLAVLLLIVCAAISTSSAQKTDSPQSGPRIVKKFISALEAKDLETIIPMLAENVTVNLAMTFTGDLSPGATFSGKQAVVGYLQQIIQGMAQSNFEDQRFIPAADEKTVFFEATGNFQTKMGTPYRNTYIVRYDIENGMLVHGTEYFNPVTAALAFGGKLGKEAQAAK